MSFISPPCNTVLLKKLTLPQLVKNTTHFAKAEGSLPFVQQPIDRPYHEPNETNPPQLFILFFSVV